MKLVCACLTQCCALLTPSLRRHGFMLKAASLHGAERMGYYVLILELIFKAFKPEHGRRVLQIFLDVACRFVQSMER